MLHKYTPGVPICRHNLICFKKYVESVIVLEKAPVNPVCSSLLRTLMMRQEYCQSCCVRLKMKIISVVETLLLLKSVFQSQIDNWRQ